MLKVFRVYFANHSHKKGWFSYEEWCLKNKCRSYVFFFFSFHIWSRHCIVNAAFFIGVVVLFSVQVISGRMSSIPYMHSYEQCTGVITRRRWIGLQNSELVTCYQQNIFIVSALYTHFGHLHDCTAGVVDLNALALIRGYISILTRHGNCKHLRHSSCSEIQQHAFVMFPSWLLSRTSKHVYYVFFLHNLNFISSLE